jgi:hypothetical protein
LIEELKKKSGIRERIYKTMAIPSISILDAVVL